VRLWKLLADTALGELNFGVADKAFVQCKDYQGVQMVKRLRVLTDKQTQRAEVAVHFQKFDEAEQIFRDIDRLDLAVELRARIGDWFRVVALLQAGSGSGNDALLKKAYNEIGYYYAHRAKWEKVRCIVSPTFHQTSTPSNALTHPPASPVHA
jgi:WD repeat-containing protein 35